ncbi:MAG: hypothetical protein DMG03_19380 [Acidobacteria bacterium]|nr:MAG: hypothetical protein DMG03_19380 [Acidobacteriota bacterium]
MKVRQSIVAAIVSSIAVTSIAGQGGFRTLTIEEAVNEAVQRNLGLLAARADLSVAEAALVTARLRPNPVLSGSADGLDWLGTGFSELNNAGPPQYAVRVDVPFERASKRELRTHVAEETRRVAEAQIADAVRRLMLEVLLASIDVLEAKAKLRLAEDTLQSFERLVQLNERRLTSGAIPQLEVSRSRVAMLQYRGNVRSAQLVLTQARLKLLPLLGKKPDEEPIDIDDRLALPASAIAADLTVLQQSARSTRPDLLAARREQARTQADLRLQLAQGKVDYTLGAEYRRQQGVNGRGNLLGLFFSARSLTALETDVAGQVASAYAEFTASRQLVDEIERDLLEPTDQGRTGTAYVYQAGAISLLDVLDAQRAYNDTMETYYSAQAAYRRAQARLTLAIGTETAQ